MSEILCHWLNEDVQLSEKIGNFQARKIVEVIFWKTYLQKLPSNILLCRYCYFVIYLTHLWNTYDEVYEPYKYIKTRSLFGNFMYYFIKRSAAIWRAFQISEDASFRGYFRLKLSPDDAFDDFFFKNWFYQNKWKEARNIGGCQIRGALF